MQGNKTNTMVTQLGVALTCVFLAFVALHLAVSQLFHMLSVHFRLPDDITMNLILYNWKVTDCRE